MHFHTISITVIFCAVGCVLVTYYHPNVTINNSEDEVDEEDLPKFCFEIYTAKLNADIKLLAMSTLDVHAWNAISIYVRNSHRRFISFGRIHEHLNRCESSFGGKVKISLQALNKYRNDCSRQLPLMLGARNLCEDLCVVQAARGAVLSDLFDPDKYGQIFNMTSVEVLNIIEDSILTNIISKMCEKMFDAQIKCLFERERRMLEQNENELVKFLLRTMVDIKEYLKHKSHLESIELPYGYIERPLYTYQSGFDGILIPINN
ncbi:uncharacterized protein LOC116349259 [Contarinia nasturtii]|uniref:uncharacterized protein LOC116349259 n=1 Tax=Contarinia nasturtii TaxID=265458 RepID=UPI0012D42591|nr:uncharacterized protein LOC116349259 [Contarinia nasturtii]